MSDPALTPGRYLWETSYPPEIDWHADIPVAPLYRLMDDAVARYGDRPCIDFMDKRYTYAQIGALVDRAARGFQALGVGKGSKVGLFLPNTPYFVICYYGILKAGGIVVNFNPLYAEREVAKQIEDSETDIMVTLDLALLYGKIAKMLQETRLKQIVVAKMADILPFPKNWLFPIFKRKDIAKIPSDHRHVPFARLIGNPGKPEPVTVDPLQDVAVLQYTGGTTGVPKGAMLTHANIYANAVQSRMWCSDAKPGQERMLGVLPLFHVFAMTGVMKSQIDWIPLSMGAIRPTQGRTLALMQVSGGSQSFNAVNQMRVLGRWMRMVTIPNQSSVAKAYDEFDEAGRMRPSSYYDRIVDVMEELVKFTLLTRDLSDFLTDRYSERKETAAKLEARVSLKAAT